MKIKSSITHEIEFLEEEKEQTIVTVGGIVETVRRIFTKKSGKEWLLSPLPMKTVSPWSV